LANFAAEGTAGEEKNDQTTMDSHSDLASGKPADAGGVIVRDDQSDFPTLLAAAGSGRRRGGLLKLIDTGTLPLSELEWLGEAGVEIYTSDQSRREARATILLSKAAAKGGAAAAYFHHGPLTDTPDGTALDVSSLLELGRSGLGVFVSNAKIRRDLAALVELAQACAKGGRPLVYYHHGPLDPAFESLAREGAWIHAAAPSLRTADDLVVFGDCVRAGRGKRGGVILHVDRELDPLWITDLLEAGVHVLFQTPPSDYRSPLRPLEIRAKSRSMDPRAFYLYPAFLL
jgi:hypothetical protein